MDSSAIIVVTENYEEFERCEVCSAVEDLHNIGFVWSDRDYRITLCRKHLVDVSDKIDVHLQ